MAARRRLFALLRDEEAPQRRMPELGQAQRDAARATPRVDMQSWRDEFDFSSVRDSDQIALHLSHKLPTVR